MTQLENWRVDAAIVMTIRRKIVVQKLIIISGTLRNKKLSRPDTFSFAMSSKHTHARALSHTHTVTRT